MIILLQRLLLFIPVKVERLIIPEGWSHIW